MNWNFLILLKLFVIEILREHLWIYALLEHFWFLTADLRQEPHFLLELFFLIMRNQRLSNPYYNSRSTVHFEQNWLKNKNLGQIVRKKKIKN